jgi:hypothetical protein
MECRLKNDASPSTTDLYKPVPPSFAAPFAPFQKLVIVDLAFVQNRGPGERKDVKKGIIVKNVDEWTMWFVVSQS